MEQKLNRDIGLSPIFNVKSDVSPCVESFTSPTYYMSGATTPMTGLTIDSSSVYNLSNVDDFTLTFNYLGYDGKFCYKTSPRYNTKSVDDRCVKYSEINTTSPSECEEDLLEYNRINDEKTLLLNQKKQELSSQIKGGNDPSLIQSLQEEIVQLEKEISSNEKEAGERTSYCLSCEKDYARLIDEKSDLEDEIQQTEEDLVNAKLTGPQSLIDNLQLKIDELTSQLKDVDDLLSEDFDCVGETLLNNNKSFNFLPGQDISREDNEYIITPYDVFYSKCVTNPFGRTGTTINTKKYKTTDLDNDYGFVTLTNPPTPSLVYELNVSLSDIQFVNDSFNVDFDGVSSFQLSDTPLGSTAVVSVNGVTMSKEDYLIEDNLLKVTGGYLSSTDTIQAYYSTSLEFGGDIIPIMDLTKLENFKVTGFTNDFFSDSLNTSYENFVNYNSSNDRYEIFLKDNVDVTIEPVLSVNGIDLVYNVDFFKSNLVQNKLILGEGLDLVVGDVVSIYYYNTGNSNPGDMGTLRSDLVPIKWSQNVKPSIKRSSYGEYVIEVYNREDSNFNTIINSGTTMYNSPISDYSLTIGPITTTNIKDYVYRLKLDKYYTDMSLNRYKTSSEYVYGSFSLDWNYINNTKF